jgi:hypothetical protein
MCTAEGWCGLGCGVLITIAVIAFGIYLGHGGSQ